MRTLSKSIRLHGRPGVQTSRCCECKIFVKYVTNMRIQVSLAHCTAAKGTFARAALVSSIVWKDLLSMSWTEHFVLGGVWAAAQCRSPCSNMNLEPEIRNSASSMSMRPGKPLYCRTQTSFRQALSEMNKPVTLESRNRTEHVDSLHQHIAAAGLKRLQHPC